MDDPDSLPLSARNVAEYFLAKVDRDAGDNISNLKLQKLLYYAQGFHVAMQDGAPLFGEPVVAWLHGPVVVGVYHDYKRFGWQGIDPPHEFDADDYLPEVREILDAVQSTYGQFSATYLMNLTHAEPPWQQTPQNGVIEPRVLGDYFRQAVEAGERGEALAGHPVWPTKSFRFQGRKVLASRLAEKRAWLAGRARAKPPGSTGWGEDEDWGASPEPR